MHKGLPTFALLLLTAACEGSAPQMACHFGEEADVASADGISFDDIALVPVEGALVALWSERAGLWWRSLSTAGAPEGPAHRLGPRCGGGFGVAGHEGGLLLACLELPSEAGDKDGRVTLLWLDRDMGPTRRTLFGSVGPESRGVAVVMTAGRPVVAWHDGRAGGDRVWLAEVTGRGEVSGHPVSRRGVAGGAPALWSDGERWLAVWAETVLDAQGETVGEVMLHDGHGAARKIATVLHSDARPLLTRDTAGLVIGYRDENPVGSKARLFVSRLSETLSPLGEPVRLGRADGTGALALLACGEDLFTVAPRTHNRNMLVGINLLSDRLERRVGERQLYQVGTSFALATAACGDDRLILLVAERGTAARPAVRLRATTLACG